eukprot:TRINITY_DN8891_c0_g1_i1.p1 TRINITY_DN8891_c0_g1~~TRINITY_DN8891_c0_g1_i1.p1  ORF type:complete len:512 (+),score=135.97 TRINITY_DN8891_c0_g1_i1:90-1538(+)
MAPTQLSRPVSAFASWAKLTVKGLKPQERVFFGFLIYIVVARLARQLRTRLLGKSGEVCKKDVKVTGTTKKFSQTESDDGSKADLGLSDAAPYYLPVLVRAMDLVQMLQTKTLSSDHTPWGKFKRELWLVFTLIPFLEVFSSHDWANPTDEQVKNHPAKDLKFRMPLFLWTIVELISTVVSLGLICDSKANLRLRDRIGATMMLGIFNGALGITYAHELLHKRDTAGTVAGTALLANVGYVHWSEEHLVGHHKNVATPEDPATARFGQSIYAFLPQTVVGTLKSAWGIEHDRLGGGPLWWLTPKNKVLSGFGYSLGWVACMSAILKQPFKKVLGYFTLQAVVGAGLLEWVNYIEHYGLERKKGEDGKYEPVDPTHSWNSPHRMSNTLLLKLQRHSDHHSFAARPYEVLRNFKESPQLPTGYAGMLPLAAFPPLFRWVMDPLVVANREGKNVEEETKKATRKVNVLTALGLVAGSALVAAIPE